ncbi:hypothetical protein [Nocardioides sp. GCM10030258]|uniref:hypothetical protein n=1 Tax=unclassified Nocardioides TaxID=2615069 RepID=UPI003619AFAC
MFLSSFRSIDLAYVGDGCQVAHPTLTWSISLVVDGSGASAPYRLVLGASLLQLGVLAPRNAEDCYMFLPLGYERSQVNPDLPYMPDPAFPEWPGTDEERAGAIARCVAGTVRYAREVDSVDALRTRYSGGDYDSAFIMPPMRELLADHS